jgi:hypothetical protein
MEAIAKKIVELILMKISLAFIKINKFILNGKVGNGFHRAGSFAGL